MGKADPRAYDQRKARNDPAQSRVAPPNDAGVGAAAEPMAPCTSS